MAEQDRKTAAALFCVIAFLIVYGSLYPFSFAAGGPDSIAIARGLSFGGTTRSDVAANVLLYLPFGACLGWLAAARFGAFAVVALTTLAAALLSSAIEFAQLYEMRRVTSLADVLCNTAGAAAGALGALAIAGGGGRKHESRIGSALRHPVAAALVLSWIGYRLAPFAPVLDPAKWTAAFAPLAGGGWFEPARFLPQLLAWLVINLIATRLSPGQPIRLTALAMAAVLAGRVLFAGSALDSAEIAGMAGALLASRALSRLPTRRAALALAAALAAAITIDGLAPFDFQIAQDRFALLPFGESLTQYRATNLADMFLRCFTNGALVWLLVLGGTSVLAATSLGAGIVFAIELLQTWLPGQTAEITDPLLAVAAGGLIALFEQPGSVGWAAPWREHA